jgi:hypothetical protein
MPGVSPEQSAAAQLTLGTGESELRLQIIDHCEQDLHVEDEALRQEDDLQ